MFIDRQVVTIVVSAGGAGTGYTGNVTGRVLAVVYAKTDYADGIDFVITAEDTGEAILTGTDVNSSQPFYPRVGVHDATGAARLYAAGGTAVAEPVAVANGRVKIVVAAGGVSKTGTFHVLIG